MLFNSFSFIIFFITTFIVYYLPFFKKNQVSILIIASLIFYAFENPWLLCLLFTSVIINSIMSYYIVFSNYKRLLLILGVIFNLALLAFFKYSNLIAVSFFDVNHSFGSFLLSIPLPIGISFFTFEGISLLVDVFRSNDPVSDRIVEPKIRVHLHKSLFFIVFFPHLVAGPILKADDFFPQISSKRLKDIDFTSCFKQLVVGYFLKVVVADNLKEYTFWIEYPYFGSQSTVTLLSMLIGYSCQIFADFAGYSLIALGLAQLFGYRLLDNFNFPYISLTFKEFWKRWHISLSTFLMKYLYIPMGGNRKGKLKMYLFLFLTMVIGGLWHGAAWSFAVWGAFHGLLLLTERMLPSIHHSNILFRILKRFWVFICVTFGWLLFKLTNFDQALHYFYSLATNLDLHLNWQICINIFVYSSPVFLYHFVYLLRLKYRSWNILFSKFEFIFYGILLFLLVTNSGISGSFIYFQF
jgi:alginate O-acetyltransferase complex protein AlgI